MKIELDRRVFINVVNWMHALIYIQEMHIQKYVQRRLIWKNLFRVLKLAAKLFLTL